MKISPNNNKPTLTLIELLVTISILSVVLTLFVSSFWSGILSYRYFQNFDKNLDALSILEQLSLNLRNAFEFKESSCGFFGTEKDIRFFTLIDRTTKTTNFTSVCFVNYRIENNKLIYSISENHRILQNKTETEILDGIDMNFSFGYITEDKDGKAKLLFKNSWEAENKNLPVAVKVELVFKDMPKQKFNRTIYLPIAFKNE